jgi:hypothetical protein
MAPRLEKVNALLGGTESMRDAGRTFLPQFAKESNAAYSRRLMRSTLFNYFRRTVDSLSGKPFVEPVRLEGYPSQVTDLMDDIDLQGNNLTVFAQRAFSEMVAKGLVHILVDYTDVEAETRADELAAGARPFLQIISPENLLAAYSNGGEQLVHARVLTTEVRLSDDGLTEEKVERVTIFTPDTISIYEVSGKDWLEIESKPNSLGVVPIVTCYAQREALMVARPPLLDLADKNIEHWQSASDQRNVLTVSRFPILAGTGMSQREADNIIVSPNQILSSENPAAKIFYVEHSGTAIAAGRQDLEDIKVEMANLAMDLLLKKVSRATATEKSLDAEEASSLLRMMVLSFTDALEQAFWMLSLRLGAEVSPEARIIISTSGTVLDSQKDIDALIAGLNSGVLTPETYIDELQRRKVLDPEKDIKPAERVIPEV